MCRKLLLNFMRFCSAITRTLDSTSALKSLREESSCSEGIRVVLIDEVCDQVPLSFVQFI